MPRWHLSAEGDAPAAQHEELAKRLRQLLGLAKFGTGASQFSGEGVNGPVHLKPEPEAADEPAEADSSS